MPIISRKLGDYIEIIDERNKNNADIPLLGVSIKKELIPSIANTVGTDMTSYKIIRKNQFAYGPVTSRNGDKISIALSQKYDEALVSQAYTTFRLKDETSLDSEYLMLWFKRSEFDRYARFKSHGSAREIFSWDEMCEVELPVPDIDTQRKIVLRHKMINQRISLIDRLTESLEEYTLKRFKKLLKDNPTIKTKLTEVANIRYGKGLPTSALTKNGYPVYGGNGIIGYYHKYICERPMLTISCRGASSGKINITTPQAFVTSNSLVVEPFSDKVSMEYLKYFSLYRNEYYEFVTGSAQPQVTVESLNKCVLELVDDDKMRSFTNMAEKTNRYIYCLMKEKEKLFNLANKMINSIDAISIKEREPS